MRKFEHKIGPVRICGALVTGVVVSALAGLAGCAGARHTPARATQHDAAIAPVNVIFLHPDGSGINMWAATRMLYAGPDGDLAWDGLPHLGIYRGHLRDALAASSNAGGTIHAYGVKVGQDKSFGNDNGAPLGRESIAKEALRRGKAVGIVSSATVADAGTGTFLADAPDRKKYTLIAQQMLEARPQVLLGGGEQFFLPKGVRGRHGEGMREDGRDLIREAREAGYHVVFTRDELLATPANVTKLLGLFAANDTFLDMPEEEQREKGTPDYVTTAPTYAEMVQAALRVLEREEEGFLLVAEEEGTDNFAGKNNARGAMVACRRADEGIAVARAFIARRPDTFLMVAADSDCGGMQVVSEFDMDPSKPLPARDDENGAPLDGATGTGTLPFLAAADARGRRLPFGVAWAAGGDVAGAVVVRGDGARAQELIRPTMDNTAIYLAMRAGLFGEELTK
jgi:alkaline phosphatase